MHVGGSEFKGETIDEYSKKDKEEAIQYRLPFGGGSGAGVNIMPVAFLVIQSNNVKLLPIEHSSSIDKLLDYVPDLVEKVNSILNKSMQNKKEEKNKERQEEIRQRREEEKAKEQTLKSKERREHVIQKTKPKRSKEPEIVYEYEYDETGQEPEEIVFDDFNNNDD